MMPGETEFVFLDREDEPPAGTSDPLPLPVRLMGASALINRCGVEKSRGGIATNFGGDNNLAVVMSDYNLQTQCRGAFPEPAARTCTDIVYNMRADNHVLIFGPASDPESQVQLPQTLESETPGCLVQLYSTGKTDSASWYEIWEAVNAVFAVCVHDQFKSGKQGNIFLVMKEFTATESPINASLEIAK
ncbi:hypothetical protein MMC28_011314 [Mycoblastus sanguinarius]|nr:hypothetical protein [Mycoblastus sanguinarius]